MSFFLLNPENAAKLGKTGSNVNEGKPAMIEEDRNSRPADALNHTIPLKPTLSEQNAYDGLMKTNLQENSVQNQELSKEALRLKEIESNVVKEMVNNGFLVKQSDSCPTFYKNLGN
mmetsp:Transcript_2414/g.2839  ORF Transcript_2414/g.2839 Transcript_2414/m.2839 type:complete len:116 (+) Transcript_2414:3-350(+)